MVEKRPDLERVVTMQLPFPGAYALDVRASERSWRYFHEAYCVTLITAGSTQWRYRHHDDAIGPASLVFMEPGEVHASKKALAPGDFCALFFPADVLQELVAPYTTRLPHFRYRSTTRCDLVGAFRAACQSLREGAAQEAEEQLRLALTAVLASATEDGLPPPRRDPRAKRGARLIREHYFDAPWHTVRVPSIAEDLGIGASTLHHTFKAEFGVTPFEYYDAIRMAKMREIFVAGPRPGLRSLTEVGAAVGFSDRAHFHRWVQKKYGISPYQFAAGVNPAWRHRGSN